MAEEKLLAEWFWIDRYDGSSAALLNMECQGVYRSMLSAAWRRGARLPNDHEAIRRAIRCTSKEWKRCWPKVEGYWRADGENGEWLVNDTQLEVYAEAMAQREAAHVRAVAAAEARWGKRAGAPAQGDAQASAQAKLKKSPPSPSPGTTNPPNPPARAGGQGPPTKAEQEATVRELVAYWRWLGRVDPRCPHGFATQPQSIPDERNVRAWRKALKVGRVNVDELKASIAERVREELTRRNVPVWDVEPWPPAEEEAPSGARRAG
jgi:uncharacterized protein YdaU (DUF1376 family)